MAQFWKSPVKVDAEQFDPRLGKGIPAAVCLKNDADHGDGLRHFDGHHVHTPNGITPVSDGDWIITDADGRRSVCKPATFKKTYESAETTHMWLRMLPPRQRPPLVLEETD